jgi:hypothetical protein
MIKRKQCFTSHVEVAHIKGQEGFKNLSKDVEDLNEKSKDIYG